MRGWQRWWPAMGLVFVVLFLVAFFLVGDTGQTSDDIAKKLPEHMHQLLAAFIVGTAAGFALLAFFASLRELVRATAPGRPVLGTLAFAPVVASGALLCGSLAILSGAAEAGDEASLTPALASFAVDTQYPFLVAAFMFIAFAVFCASLALLRTGALPGWLCWAGVVVGVIELAAVLFFPMILVLLWILVASIMLLVRGGRARPAV